MKVKIGDLTKIRTGKLDANASSEDGQYLFFTCSREPLRISSYSYDCECVLVAGNGDLNVKYYKGKFDAYQRTYIIEDNSDGKLYMPYLYYFMEGYIEELRKQAIGGVIKYIKLGNLTDALIELPSYNKQKKVVNILEKSKKIIELQDDEITKFDQLIKARFVEMFG
ncbi:MAG: restriction endonuclease subunit S, partial [Christensenellales bacterium]